EKHTKCSGEATCERCALRNLECTFIDSGKKRGTVNTHHASTLSLFGYPQQQLDNIDDVTPYSEFYDPERVYIHNNFENDIDGTSMLRSMTINPMQSHASTISQIPSTTIR
ncbi:34063_t:CDS:2, partial [Gigaspora margarita]